MSELGETNRTALGPGVTLAALPEGQVLLLLGRAGAPEPNLAGLRAAGPGQWFLVGDAPLPEPGMADLAARLPDVAISDQSHGRVRIAVSGPQSLAMLAKGTAVDLARMPVGGATVTLIGPLGVHLTRTGETTFELMVLRSFAAALWHDLEAMAAEY